MPTLAHVNAACLVRSQPFVSKLLQITPMLWKTRVVTTLGQAGTQEILALGAAQERHPQLYSKMSEFCLLAKVTFSGTSLDSTTLSQMETSFHWHPESQARISLHGLDATPTPRE